MKEQTECNEAARMTLPWAGKLLNYCPVHANQIAALGQAMGSPIQAQLIPSTASYQCESNEPLTDEEKVLNERFQY